VHVAGVCRGRGENLFDEGELCSEYFFKVKEVIWVNSFDGNHSMVVYKFGMNESCFGKGLWAFVLCFEKDEFVFFGDCQVGLCKKCRLICGSGLFEQRHSIPLW
jgi:hypothetical protein